ncbi:ABC transporter [Klebsiella variicola]|uniref:Transport permease protein n=1 Tax=Klebsiella variicola TaxID=244366 RepID=A0A7H4MG84_KLEVA|nr:ABC transporter [Klebsiella variicola]
MALNAAFLPSIMLSGFIFQIDSMPAVIRAVTYVIPARYFVNTLQSLFLAGNIPVVLLVNVLFLIASAVMFIGLTWVKNQAASGLGFARWRCADRAYGLTNIDYTVRRSPRPGKTQCRPAWLNGPKEQLCFTVYGH